MKNTITLCSLAEHALTKNTILNALEWTDSLDIHQDIKRHQDKLPDMTIEYCQKEFERRLRESGLQIKVKRLFRIIHPTFEGTPSNKFYDSGWRWLRLFERLDIDYTLLPSEGMSEDLQLIERNSPPLYERIKKHISE